MPNIHAIMQLYFPFLLLALDCIEIIWFDRFDGNVITTVFVITS